MPQIVPASRLSLNTQKPDKIQKYIKAEFISGKDFLANQLYSLVIDADWFNGDANTTVNGRSLTFDLSQYMKAGGMQDLQTVYIDNNVGNGIATLQALTSGQRISCPANSQGWFPLIMPQDDGKFQIGYDDKYNANGRYDPSWTIASSVVSVGAPVPAPYRFTMFFTDLAVPPCVWEAKPKWGYAINEADGVAVPPSTPTPITGGPGNARLGFRLRVDESSATGIDVGFFDSATNAVKFGWYMLPGQTLEFEGDGVPINAIYLLAGASGGSVQYFEVI